MINSFRDHLVSTIALSLLLIIGSALSASAGSDFTVRGNEVHMSGEITSDSLNQFEKIHTKQPHVDTIVLHQIDGSSDDETMIELGYYVRDNGFNTRLMANSAIYSGGVDLFLAGVNRTMENGAKLGVHSWSDGIRDGADYPKSSPEHDMNNDYLFDMLGSEEFYWFTLSAAPADSIHEMSHAEIKKFKLLTSPIIFK